MVTSGILLQPEHEVEIFRGLLDIEEIFFKILETEGRKVFPLKHIVETNVQQWCERT